MKSDKITFDRDTTLCFSGHRYYAGGVAGVEPPGQDERHPHRDERRAQDEHRLAAAIEAAFADGYRTFISGMASGFDLAAAEAVLKFRALRLWSHCREDKDAVGDVGSKVADEEAPEVKNAAESPTSIRLIAAIPFAGQAAGYSPADRTRYEAVLAEADEVVMLSDHYSHGCYYRRDEWMVDRSGRLICWYDGSVGGTRYTVRRALASGLEIVNLFRAPGALF